MVLLNIFASQTDFVRVRLTVAPDTVTVKYSFDFFYMFYENTKQL